MSDSIYPELRSLIPSVDQMKLVGPIFDADTYLRSGRHSAENLLKFAYLKPATSVLDVGCGFGRVAIHLAQILTRDAHYFGLDVVRKEIEWCTQNITPHYGNFQFRHVDAVNEMYNPTGKKSPVDIEFPVPAGMTFNLAILFSVFTHMLPGHVQAYLYEIARHLAPGGILFASFFLMNRDSSRAVQEGRAQFKFVEQPEGYFAHNLSLHEGAVAYTDDAVWEMLSQAGFRRDKIIYGNWSGKILAESGQDLVICRKV